MRAVFVPPETNDGSAFMHHVVMIWTVGQHTYGIGFHNEHGIRQTLALDKALAGDQARAPLSNRRSLAPRLAPGIA